MGDLRPGADTMRRHSIDLTEASLPLDESNRVPSDDSMNDDLDLSLPPAEDDLVLGDENRVFAPPPRVAARFYRPSQARRRDSAASSRRNSISSAHSRCSSAQPARDRSGQQSKYVAQHLRRASFLEDRKARLADRAAHAEKVRLRAALAKATLRDTTQSEERALAAQQARERNLAEIVANCGEEVKKAKQIAEFMKEKREQDSLRVKAQMEERMAEAEKRREELRKNNTFRRSRGQNVMNRKLEVLPRVTEQEARKLTDEEAASRVQGWWRGVRRKSTIDEFNNLGLTVDGIRDTSFETVIELLAQEKVLMTTARLLQICGLEEGDSKSVEEMAAVRTFLSAFLILGHPNQVLRNKDDNGAGETSLAAHRLPSSDLESPQLQDLIGKAKDLLVSFENILGRLTSANRYTMPPALEKTLPEAYATFYNAFIAWKSRDSNALIEVMLLQFVELDAIFHTVKDATDDAATALYRQSIRENQLMLIVRIKKLAGPEKGKKMIFEAVSEARKARALKKKTGDAKPRLAEGDPVDPSETAKTLISTETQTPTPPATPSSKTSARPVVKGALNGLLPDNRVVVHELAINSEYRISAEEYRAQQAEISQPLYLQMRANMLDENDHETKFKFFMTMAKNIKDKLQRLLKPGNAVFNLLEDILDLNMIQRQYVVGNFSYEKFFAAMASLLPQMCAPIRDEEVKDLVQNKIADGNILDRVEALNGFIDVMICDYINYMLKVAAPTLIETAAPYEAKRFQQDVEGGVHGLGVAEAAWRSARTKILGELQRRDPEGINHPKSRPTAERFYAQMLVDIFTKPGEVRADEIPEMFRLDVSRIQKVSLLIQRIVTVGAILLQCKNILKRDARSPWKTEASRIMSVLESNHPFEAMVDGVMAALESGRSMPAATKAQLRGFVTRTLTATREMYAQGADSRDPVLRLLLTRLRGNILSRLVPGSASDKVKVASNAGEKLASLGLSEFVENIRLVSDLLEKIGAVDRAAHSPWWDALALKIEQEESSANS